MEVDKISGQGLRDVCEVAEASASGMDLWGPMDFTLPSDQAYT